MSLGEQERNFIEGHRAAAMVTQRGDGTSHAVRVGIALVDGKLWSSGTPARVRTRHLRQDPRCTLFVFDPVWNYLTLEGTVTILDGPEAPEANLRLFRQMQRGMSPGPAPGKLLWEGQERSEDEFLRIMVEEQRLIYELEVTRTYGMY